MQKEWRRLDHQHVVDLRIDRLSGIRGLSRFEGGGATAHQIDRARARQGQDPSEFHPPRRDRDADASRGDRDRVQPRAARAEWMKGEPIGRFGTPEDIAYGAALPGLGRILVRDRHGARHRRGLDRAVIPLPGSSTRRCRAARRSMRRANARARKSDPAAEFASRGLRAADCGARDVARRPRPSDGHSGYRRVVAQVGVGLAPCVTEGGGAARYEGRPQRHDHAYCLACRRLFYDRRPRRPLRPLRGRLSSRRFRLVASELPEQHS